MMIRSLLAVCIVLLGPGLAATSPVFTDMVRDTAEKICKQIHRVSVTEVRGDISGISAINATGNTLCFSGPKRVTARTGDGERRVLQFRLQVFAVVPVFRETVPRDAVLTDSAVDKHVVEITRRMHGKTVDSVEGYRTKVRVSAGTPVLRRHLRKLRLVQYGEEVRVQFVDGSITIEMTGIARGNAALHETVAVLNPLSRKVIYGRVTGDGAVTLIGGRK